MSSKKTSCVRSEEASEKFENVEFYNREGAKYLRKGEKVEGRSRRFVRSRFLEGKEAAAVATAYLPSVERSRRECDFTAEDERDEGTMYALSFDSIVRSPTAVRTLVVNGMTLLHQRSKIPGRAPVDRRRTPANRRLLVSEIGKMQKNIGSADLLKKSSAMKNKLRTYRVRSLLNDGLKLASVVWSRLVPEETYRAIRWWQRLNHFPGRHVLGHKDKIATLLRDVKSALPRDYDFNVMPDTFVLSGPLEKHTFLSRALRADDAAVWIRKPCVSSMGRGIHVFRASDATLELGDIDANDPNTWVVVQRYITNPYLVARKKADMRVYVLVTSFDPLSVYLATDGIVKFCTSDFDMSPEKMKVREAHLANQAINKFSPDFVMNQSIDSGSRWTHRGYWRHLTKMHGDAKVRIAMSRLEDLVVKTFASAVKHVMTETQRLGCESNLSNLSCFEVFGLDVEMDDELTPHLLEVNVAPEIMVRPGDSMSMQVVGRLASDAFHIAGVRARPSSEECRPRARLAERARCGAIDTIWKTCSEDERFQLAELENQLERSRTTVFRRVYPKVQNLQRIGEILKLASTDGSLPRRQALLQRWELAMRRLSADP